MHNEKQDWGKAYQQLATLITTKVPAIKHVDLYYGQQNLLDGDGNWIPFPSPAVFLQFDAVIEDLGELRQQQTFDITVYLCVETVQDTHQGGLGQARAMQFVELMRQLHQHLHNAQGDDFGPLSRIGMRKEDAPPHMYFYSQTFRTVLLDYGATENWTELGELSPPLDPGLQVSPMPPEEPGASGNSVRVYNSDLTYDELVGAPGLLPLPDVTHTDSDGQPRVLPAMTPMVCAPAGSVGTVAILDQHGNLVANVTAPGSYSVVVLNGINDEEPYTSVMTINDI